MVMLYFIIEQVVQMLKRKIQSVDSIVVDVVNS